MLELNSHPRVMVSLLGGLRPITKDFIDKVLTNNDNAKSKLPEIAEMVKADEDIPEELRNAIYDALPQYLADSKDPKVDPVSIDTVLDTCIKWSKEYMISNFPDQSDTVSTGVAELYKWMEFHNIEPIQVRCSDPNCTQLHTMIPCRVPLKWVNFDDVLTGISEEVFKEDEHLNTCIALEDLLSVMTGQLKNFISVISQMAEMFPQYDPPPDGQLELGNIRIHKSENQTVGIKFDVNVLAFKEWANLQRILHYKNAEGVWTKR